MHKVFFVVGKLFILQQNTCFYDVTELVKKVRSFKNKNFKAS